MLSIDANLLLFTQSTRLALQVFGVTEFATANVKDFEGLGFAKVWKPVAVE